MQTHQADSPSTSRQHNAPLLSVLPDELIVEVLSWLPVKSLLQFRCVCKSWKSLISKPNFVKLHLQRSPRNVNLLLLKNNNLDIVSVSSLLENPSPPIAEDDCYALNRNNGYRVVGSCNGLVCLLGVNCTTNCFLEYWFNLWNPATKITSKDLACLGVGDCRINMIQRFAFGYDNLSDTYKVLAFCLDTKAKEESQKIQVRICSSGNNRWRNIDSFPVIPFHTPRDIWHNNGVHFNGTLNWLAACKIISDDYEWNDTITIAQLVIVSLDLGMETYTQVLLPCHDETPQAEPIIGVLMDCLCFSHDLNGTHFVVWQMKEAEVEKSWTQFIKVTYQDLQIVWLDMPSPMFPLCTSENGEVLIMAAIDEMEAILYHRRDNRAKHTETEHPNYIFWDKTMGYVESLVSPCCN